MPDETLALREILSDCLNSAKNLGVPLEYELTEAVDMEFESTNATVRFSAAEGVSTSLNVLQLLDQLEKQSVVASIELFAPPEAKLLIGGALKNRHYRVSILLDKPDVH